MKPIARTRLRLALVLLLSGTSCAAARADERPNVLVVLTDDQGMGDFSLHGNPYLSTPNIDELGRQSVRFDRFYVNTFCAPTRAALLTGLYSLRSGVFGVTHSKEVMRSEAVTLAEVLRDAGYRTACIGKWHNGEQFPRTPPGQGFDEFFGFHAGHINNYFDTELLRGTRPEPTHGYISDVLTDEAVRFVTAPRDQPFFCWLAFNAPHTPSQVPDRYFDKFKARGLDDTVSAFYGMCENLDDNVGRLLTALDEKRLTENTIVVFMTDNGGTGGLKHFNAGMRGGKTSVHEGGSRVPCFIRWPRRFHQPRVIDQIAAHIDVMPTLLDLCRVGTLHNLPGSHRSHWTSSDTPQGPGPGAPMPALSLDFDGRSLRPLMEGRSDDWPRRALFTHNPINETNRYPGAVRTQRWRLVREIKGPMGGSRAKENDASATSWQLYDMQADPAEEHDLARQEPDLVARLSREYEAWFDDVSSSGLKRPPIPVGYTEENPVELHAPQAYFSGSLKFFGGPGFSHDWLTDWTGPASRVWFELDVAQAGDFEITLRYACPRADAGSRIRVSVGHQNIEAIVAPAEAPLVPLPHRTDNKSSYYTNRRWGLLPVGTLSLRKGPARLRIEAVEAPGSRVMDLKGVILKRQ